MKRDAIEPMVAAGGADRTTQGFAEARSADDARGFGLPATFFGRPSGSPKYIFTSTGEDQDSQCRVEGRANIFEECFE